MTERRRAAIVLAAGKGTRMHTPEPKPLVPVGGRPIILRLLDALQGAGIRRIAVVVGHRAEAVRAALPTDVATPLQTDRRGTAHAVEAARDAVEGAEEILVFVGDSPLIQPQSISHLCQTHRARQAAISFLTASFGQHFPYARVIRDRRGSVQEVVEERDCRPEQLPIREYLTSHFVFEADALWAVLPMIKPHAITGERYLTDAIGLLLAQNRSVEAVMIPHWEELVGLNTLDEISWAESLLQVWSGSPKSHA